MGDRRVQFNVKVAPAVMEQVRRQADLEGRFLGRIVEDAIAQYLERNPDPSGKRRQRRAVPA